MKSFKLLHREFQPCMKNLWTHIMKSSKLLHFSVSLCHHWELTIWDTPSCFIARFNFIWQKRELQLWNPLSCFMESLSIMSQKLSIRIMKSSKLLHWELVFSSRYTRCFRINVAKLTLDKMKTNWWFLMRFSVSYAEINQVLLHIIRFLIFSQTRQLCAFLEGGRKIGIG